MSFDPSYEPRDGLTHRDADWSGLRVLVVGLGVSGFAAADALAEVGLDIRDDDACLALFRKAGAKVDGMRVTFEPGHLREILKTAPK